MANLKTALYALGVIIGLLGLNAYLVSDSELDAEITDLEVRTVQTLEQFQGSIRQGRQLDRYTRLNDDLHRARILSFQYPSNEQLKSEVRRLEAELARLKEELGI